MELVRLCKELVQSAVETAVSYRAGQAVLRYVDRGLWVVEKSAQWAVPPALETEDNAPELVRPLPWPLFLVTLLALRVIRESASLLNLLLGEQPVRPTDIVAFIQSKRRYLRALKYQGNRNMRARANWPQGGHSGQWLSSFYSLLQTSMCFRRPLDHPGNNTTQVSHSDIEVPVVSKSKKRGIKMHPRSHASPPADENPMERLIGRMANMGGESSDDSEYEPTNATIKSDNSITSDEEDTMKDTTLTEAGNGDMASSTPNKSNEPASTPPVDIAKDTLNDAPPDAQTNVDTQPDAQDSLLDTKAENSLEGSPKEASNALIGSEKNPESPKKTKLANGRSPKTSLISKKESPRRQDSEVPIFKITADPNITNGSVEDLCSQSDNPSTPGRARSAEKELKKVASNKTSVKSQRKQNEKNAKK